MANLTGTEKVTENFNTRTIITGVAKATPIACNPSSEKLAELTNGRVKRNELPTDKDYRMLEIWFEVGFDVEEDKLIQNPDTVAGMEEYVKISIFLRNEDHETQNGAWYVDSKTCETSYVKTGEKAPMGYKLAKKGQVELYNFLADWLNIIEIDFETPFAELMRGNVAEINDVIEQNLNASTTKQVTLMLAAKLGAGGTYQDVYKKIKRPNQSNTFFASKVKQDSFFMNDHAISEELQFYKESFDIIETPNANPW